MWKVQDEESIILYVGRIHIDKDPMKLVQTASLIAASTRKFRMVVIGDGPMLSEVQNAVRLTESISDRFIWLGAQPRSVIADF